MLMKITQSILILFLIIVIVSFNKDLFNFDYVKQFIIKINENEKVKHKEQMSINHIDDVFNDDNCDDDVFATENALTEDADCAISDALKSVR